MIKDISILGQSNVFSGADVVFRCVMNSRSFPAPIICLVIGGTKVRVRGGPFLNLDDIVCRFGEKIVDATYHDVVEKSCIRD